MRPIAHARARLEALDGARHECRRRPGVLGARVPGPARELAWDEQVPVLLEEGFRHGGYAPIENIASMSWRENISKATIV